MDQRLLPYVEDRTLQTVISRLQEREYEYLLHITNKIRRENPILLPDEFRPHHILPVIFGVYELVSLSLGQRKMPIVDEDALMRIGKVYNLKEVVKGRDIFFIEHNPNFEGNDNIIKFIGWTSDRIPPPLNILMGSSIYSAIREQERRDRIRLN